MTTRTVAISDLRDRFARDGYPRLTMCVILALAGAIAFLSSVAALRAGVASMGFRYGLAVLVGYAAFLVLMRGWIALHRGEWSCGLDALDAADMAETAAGAGRWSSTRVLAGGAGIGDSGGAVAPATATLDPTPALERGGNAADRTARVERRREDSSFFTRILDAVTVDLDELGFVLVVIVGALGAAFAVFYVIYAAPLLLAEVALDAALVSALYRRLRQEDIGHWAGAVVRHTWRPTLSLFVCMSAAGFALQRIVPSAHSIGGVVRAFVK